jgi:hypothetical protein
MDLYDQLSGLTIAGLTLTCTGAVLSQAFRSSEEVAGRLTKRLTPAGWLWLGISLVGLSGSIASELVRIGIRGNEAIEKANQIAEAKREKQRQALEAELEKARQARIEGLRQQWQGDVRMLLEAAKSDIGQNLINTISGFERSQRGIRETQARVASTRQAVVEAGVAGQPLNSLHLRWEFSSDDAALRQIIAKGADEIGENAVDVQGGVPRTPFEVVEMEAAILPLFRHIAAWAPSGRKREDDQRGLLVLIALDDAANAVLAFGDAEGAKTDAPAAGSERHGASSIPWLVSPRGRAEGSSTLYSVDWTLAPDELFSSLYRRNPAIPATAKLPRTLKVAIVYDFSYLPFTGADLSRPRATNLWTSQARDRRPASRRLPPMRMIVEVNNYLESPRIYRLASVYAPGLFEDAGDELEASCTILEFELVDAPA